MPTYSYSCSSCGYEFEKFQVIVAGPLRKCPECKKLKLKRLIGAGSGIIFRGSGFYINDYGNNKKKIEKKADNKKIKKGQAKNIGEKE